MRLASALETTPNEFLIGTNSSDNAEWEDIADMLRYFDKKKLSLTKNFLIWLSEQELYSSYLFFTLQTRILNYFEYSGFYFFTIHWFSKISIKTQHIPQNVS